jgi:hypothetical protein
MQIPQPQIIVFAVAIYCLLILCLGHIRSIYSVDPQMLHLHTACCGCSAVASAIASWADYAQNSPSALNRIPPLAIYLRLVALFLF